MTEHRRHRLLPAPSLRASPTIVAGFPRGATHHFALDDTMDAYDTFADAASTDALKVVLQGSERGPGSNGRIGASVVAGAA